MVPLIGELYRASDIVANVHGRRLVGLSSTEILAAHERAEDLRNHPVLLSDTLRVLTALVELTRANRARPASIDIARIADDHADQDVALPDYLRATLHEIFDAPETPSGADVVLFGFGRIGRLFARILLSRRAGGSGLRLRAIVVRRGSDTDLIKRAALLERDSVHGRFPGTVRVDVENAQLIVNGTRVQIIYGDAPSAVDYEKYGIRDAIIVDNTGKWRKQADLEKHLAAPGAAKVLLTAPADTPIPNVVVGVNHDAIDVDTTVVAAASCTTNAVTPVLKALVDGYGVVRGHVETVHAFTNDQNLIDNFHKGDRRGRSAVLNMVITETGAAKAVAKALPIMEGRLTGSAIRVPTPDVSLAILNLELERPTTVEELNEFLRGIALHSTLRQQIDYVEEPDIVSSDFVGSERAAIVDGRATIAKGVNVILYVWYDNEFGYSWQGVRLLEHMAGVSPVVLPERQSILSQTAYPAPQGELVAAR